MSLLLSLILLTPRVFAGVFDQPMVRDGAVSELTGYPGTTYQAIRYEPICGSIGSGEQYAVPIDAGSRCTAAMNTFGNDTISAFAVYDATGVLLESADAIIGNGKEVCMCFALAAASGDGMGAICVAIDGTGTAEYSYMSFIVSDYILDGGYRVVGKALPRCTEVDLQQVKDSWSATAALPTATGKSGGGSSGGKSNSRSIAMPVTPWTFEFST